MKIKHRHTVELTRGQIIEMVNNARAEKSGVGDRIPPDAEVSVECSEAGRDLVTDMMPLRIEWSDES